MKEVMIPAYESATRQMFQQTSTTLDAGLKQFYANQTNANSSALQAMSGQMAKMNEVIESLSSEVKQLRAIVQQNAAAAGGGSSPNGNLQGAAASSGGPTQPPTDTRTEIRLLCQANRYEDAFTKAVSASDGGVVMFICKNVNPGLIFNAGSPVLSQTVLLCLMQQLGAVLLTATEAEDMKLILLWLQEVAVTIDPKDVNIQRRKSGTACFSGC